MAAKSENIFVRAKAYQAKHPRTPWANCIQACKGKKKVSGTKCSTVDKVKTGKAAVSGTRKHKKASAVKVATSTAKHDVISRSQKIINEIERLEKKRTSQKTKEMKDIVQLVINAKHHELNNIMSNLKKRG